MFILQVISYILEIALIILIGGFFILYPESIFEKYAKQSDKYKEVTFINSEREKKNHTKITYTLISVVVGITTLYLLVPYILDLPNLVLGKFSYTFGPVYEIRRERKSFYEYANIGGKEVKFVFSANVDTNQSYKIGYLPHTKRAMFGEVLSSNNIENHKKIKFPLVEIISFLGIIAAIIFLIFISPYVKMKLLGVSSLIFYPFILYLYFKNGFNYGTWFSLVNKELLTLLLGLTGLLTLLLVYFIERHKNEDYFLTFLYAQVIAVLQIITVVFYLTNGGL